MKIDSKKWLHDIAKEPSQIKQEYNEICHDYDNDVNLMGYSAPTFVRSLLTTYAPDTNISILDVGCGTGLIGQELKKYDYSDITGMDISAGCLEKAEDKKAYTTLIEHNLLEKFPLPDGSFDCITCVAVFSRLSESQIQETIREFTRVLRENGLIIFSHRDDLITTSLKQAIADIKELELEELTKEFPYYEKDDHYKDISIRFFILRKK